MTDKHKLPDEKVKIDKNVPMPTKRGTWGEIAAKMEHGDSVELETRNEAQALSQAISRNLGDVGYGVSRQLDNGKYRVWCVHKAVN